MYQITPATVADIATIREIAAIAFRNTYAEIITPAQMDFMMEWMYSAESLRLQMERDHHTYYLLRDTDSHHALGYVSIQPIESDVYELQKIYLLPSCKGQGLGVLLFRHAISEVHRLRPAPGRVGREESRRGAGGVEV